MNKVHALITILSATTLAACGQAVEKQAAEEGALLADEPAAIEGDCPVANESGIIEIAPGLSAKIIKTGYGRAAASGDYADTNVWLWQLDETAPDRRGQFVWESGDSVFQFQLGSGQVIKGWDMGVPCMLEGETRELVVASNLAYGAAGRGATIPPHTPLIFTIELVKLTSPDSPAS